MDQHDVVLIGGGQSGLALGYYLRRITLHYVILDAERELGGAWRHGESFAGHRMREAQQIPDARV